MNIDDICVKCIEAIRKADYNESTIIYYNGVIRRFKQFCKEREISEYSSDIGKQYADDVISKKTGKFSPSRYYSQGRFFRLIDSYYNSGCFDFSILKHGRIVPDNSLHKIIYTDYQEYLRKVYENENTIHFYEYGMYSLLQFLHRLGHSRLCELQSNMIIRYIKETKLARQREVLCELRGIFRYLERSDLLAAIAGIHAPRIKRIVPTLTKDEVQKLELVLNGDLLTKRDKAIVITGLSCGIRACDLIKLKLSDIDWDNETITFKQSKTGNLVLLPLTLTVGNAIARYISSERPDIESNYLFLRSRAPFSPLTDHASCHAIVKKVFQLAGIKKENRIYGMHMLRHNAAATMVKNDMPIETIAAILGHSSPDTTDTYISTDEERLRECVLPICAISTEVNP